MENEIKTEKVLLKKEKLALNIEQLIENDLSLPDYCGDIVKILSCTAQTNIFSGSITGDKAVVNGMILIRMIYVDSSSKTEVYEMIYPFNRSVDVKNADENDLVDVSCVSEQISCRAVNSRRADVRGSVTLKICVTGTDECDFLVSAPEDFCHTLKTSAKGSFLKCCFRKPFTLSAENDSDDKIKNAKIIRTSCIPIVNEVKTIKNKMMVRGNVAADITMLNSSGNFISDRVNIPVNQIIDAEGVDDESDCCVNLKVQSIDARIVPDTPSSPAHIEVSAVVCACIDVFSKKDITAVTEAYSPKCELICKTDKVRCISSVVRVNENHTVTAKHDFASGKAVAVSDVAVKKIRYTVHSENNAVVLKGNIHYGIIVVSDESEKLYFERISDFEYRKQTNEDVPDYEFNPVVSLNSMDFSLSPDGTAVINTEMRIDGFIYPSCEMTVISAVDKGEERKTDTDNCVITVYFASKGERLWDIAKEHNTSVKMLRELNSINEDVLEKDCMLVFDRE